MREAEGREQSGVPGDKSRGCWGRREGLAQAKGGKDGEVAEDFSNLVALVALREVLERTSAGQWREGEGGEEGMLAPRNVGPERDKGGRGPTVPLEGLALGGRGAAAQDVCGAEP